MLINHEWTIQAGFSTPIDEASRYSMDIAKYVIEKPGTSVMVSVNGTSMEDAWIFSGDKLIVEQSAQAKQWDMVIAKIDDCYTLKFFDKDPKWFVYLRAASQNIWEKYPEESLEILWVVKTVIRKL